MLSRLEERIGPRHLHYKNDIVLGEDKEEHADYDSVIILNYPDINEASEARRPTRRCSLFPEPFPSECATHGIASPDRSFRIFAKRFGYNSAR